MLDDTNDRAGFHSMVEGTQEDYQKIQKAFGEFSKDATGSCDGSFANAAG